MKFVGQSDCNLICGENVGKCRKVYLCDMTLIVQEAKKGKKKKIQVVIKEKSNVDCERKLLSDEVHFLQLTSTLTRLHSNGISGSASERRHPPIEFKNWV